MKNAVILRKTYEFVDYPEVYENYRVYELPYPVFFCETSILVTDCDDFFVLKEDIQQTKHINPDCRIIVITPPTMICLIHSLFPEVEIIRNDVPLVFSSIVTGFSLEKLDKKKLELTDREVKYLEYLATGMKDLAISEKIFVSYRTLKRIKNDLLTKTGLISNSQLAVFSVLYQKNRPVIRKEQTKKRKRKARIKDDTGPCLFK